MENWEHGYSHLARTKQTLKLMRLKKPAIPEGSQRHTKEGAALIMISLIG